MKEYFEKIHIKSDHDLPKEGKYMVHCKVYDDLIQLWDCATPHRRLWTKNIDWYLRPVEQKPDCYPAEFIEWLIADGYFFYMGNYKGAVSFGSLRDGFNDYRKYYLKDTFRFWQANIKEK